MKSTASFINEKYEILKEIGRGGMSVVYLAMDKHLNKQWAIKEIKKVGNSQNDEIIVNSLLAEANMMKRLDHPALPRIVDIIDNGVTIYVVMDYIEGESLDKVLKIYGIPEEEIVFEWAKQLCSALSYLHSQKPPIIYRDMKPANIMLKPEGNIKIIDFGIAREYKEESVSDTTILGTKGYAPPEQYIGQTDIRSDIYALGMTLHHLLTGVDPRSGEQYVPIRQWNPNLSEGMEAIIDKCVQTAAENRYQNCAELMYDLEHPDLITKDFRKKQKKKLGYFVVSAVLCVIMAISGVFCNVKFTNMKKNEYDSYMYAYNYSQALECVQNYSEQYDVLKKWAKSLTKNQYADKELEFREKNPNGVDALAIYVVENNLTELFDNLEIKDKNALIHSLLTFGTKALFIEYKNNIYNIYDNASKMEKYFENLKKYAIQGSSDEALINIHFLICKIINNVSKQDGNVRHNTVDENSEIIENIRELYEDIMECRNKHNDEYKKITDTCRLQLCDKAISCLSDKVNIEDEVRQTILHNTCVIFGDIDDSKLKEKYKELYDSIYEDLDQIIRDMDEGQIKSILDDIGENGKNKYYLDTLDIELKKSNKEDN
ncbi:MAG: serine/threonine protein kinase [Acutalibacteraceae bacterium]